MKYLLDTDVLAELMRPVPSSALLRRVASTTAADQATSSIALGELVYGTAFVEHRATDRPQPVDEAVLANLRVIPFDEPAAQTYGRLRAELEQRGVGVEETDLRVASIALAHSLILVTAAVSRYEHIPSLTAENWLT
jgi:tRNA(fMet)-specific endonuclease VapC